MEKVIFKKVRNIHGLTQAEMAKMIGISRKEFADAEKGIDSLSSESAAEFCRIFEVPASFVVCQIPKPEPKPKPAPRKAPAKENGNGATKQQKFEIRRNCGYDEGIKEEYVQWATGDNSKTSLNDLTYDQAAQVIAKQLGRPYVAENWATFDRDNRQHKYIRSLCIQFGMSREHKKYGQVADLDALNEWMHSKRCPVQKPLLQMDTKELSKIINALSAMTVKKYK